MMKQKSIHIRKEMYRRSMRYYSEVRDRANEKKKKRKLGKEWLMNCCAGETARIYSDLNILGPVSVFPNFDEYNGAVESIEDEKRKGQTRDDSPRQKSIK